MKFEYKWLLHEKQRLPFENICTEIRHGILYFIDLVQVLLTILCMPDKMMDQAVDTVDTLMIIVFLRRYTECMNQFADTISVNNLVYIRFHLL